MKYTPLLYSVSSLFCLLNIFICPVFANFNILKAAPNIVRVDLVHPHQPSPSRGSGFIYKVNPGIGIAYVCTANHVIRVDHLKNTEIIIWHFTPEIKADLLKLHRTTKSYDSYEDYALGIFALDFDDKNVLESLKIAKENPKPGDPLYIYGSERLMGPSVRVARLISLQEDGKILKISPFTQGGGSGSPIFNKKGEVIGMVIQATRDEYTLAISAIYMKF